MFALQVLHIPLGYRIRLPGEEVPYPYPSLALAFDLI